MKKDGIKIRIDSKLKEKFKGICEEEGLTMSNKIIDFILSEIKNKSNNNLEEQILNFIGHPNLKLTQKPIFVIDTNGNIVSNDSSGRVIQVSTYQINLESFLEIIENKNVYLHLNGSNIKNGCIRAAII